MFPFPLIYSLNLLKNPTWICNWICSFVWISRILLHLATNSKSQLFHEFISNAKFWNLLQFSCQMAKVSQCVCGGSCGFSVYMSVCCGWWSPGKDFDLMRMRCVVRWLPLNGFAFAGPPPCISLGFLPKPLGPRGWISHQTIHPSIIFFTLRSLSWDLWCGANRFLAQNINNTHTGTYRHRRCLFKCECVCVQ